MGTVAALFISVTAAGAGVTTWADKLRKEPLAWALVGTGAVASIFFALCAWTDLIR